MSVSPISSNSYQYDDASIQATSSQRRPPFQGLADALQNGDLASAQSAFAALQGSGTARAGATDPSQASQSSGQATGVRSSVQALANALRSGDLDGAREAFAALQKGHHGRHHGHHVSNGDQAPASAPGDQTSSQDLSPSPIGSTLNVTA